MNHNIRSKTKSQTNKHTSVQYFSERIIPIENILQDPKKMLKDMKISDKRTLCSLLSMSQKFKELYPSQETIGRIAGTYREEANRSVGRLCEMGLIAKAGYNNKTSNYRITDYLTNPDKIWRAAMMAASIFWYINLVSYPQKWLNVDICTRYNNIRYSLSLECNYQQQSFYLKSLSKGIVDVLIVVDNKKKNHNQKNGTRKNRNMDNLKVENYIHEYIKNQKELNLDLEQEILLSIFPINALEYGFNNLKGKKDFGYLRVLCENYCKDKNIKPNWRQYYQLCEIAGIDVSNRKKTQKDDGKVRSDSHRHKRSSNFLELAYMNPAEVFLKQNREMSKYEFNRIIDKKTFWQMGVVNMVGPAFIGFCGGDLITNNAPKMHPDEILYKLDSLVRSDTFRQIQLDFGHQLAGDFLFICLEAVLFEQSSCKNSKYKNAAQKDKAIMHQNNLAEFLMSNDYELLSDLIGPELLKNYVLQIVSNWTKVVEW